MITVVCLVRRAQLAYNRSAFRVERLRCMVKVLGISRLAAQHDEIERLRRQIAESSTVRQLPNGASRKAPYGSCS